MLKLSQATRKIFLFSLLSRAIQLFIPFFMVNRFSGQVFFHSFGEFLTSFAGQWDGSHYLFIAQHGYVNVGTERLFIVFPPFYPFLIRVSDVFLHHLAFTAIIVSNVLFILGSLFFYKLLRLDYSERFSLGAVFLVAIFPAAYFFSTAYAESLFFFLVCAALYYARKNHFLPASVLAGLATLTKPFGLIIWPTIIIEWWLSEEKKRLDILIVLFFLLLAAEIYFFLNYALFKDFFAFQKFLQENWYKSFASPWEGIRGLWGRTSWTSLDALEFIATVTAWLFSFLGFIKWAKLRFSYAIYHFLAVLFFSSTGFILSSPRYLLSIPPFFILLTRIVNHKIIRPLWIMISLGLLLYLSFLFAQGHWAF